MRIGSTFTTTPNITPLWIFTGILAAVFVLDNIIMGGQLTQLGAARQQGPLWGILTYNFLHGGLFHILMNGAAIIVGGKIILHAWTKHTLWLVMVTSGIGGGIAIWLFGPDAIGASGITFGMFAFIAANYIQDKEGFWNQHYGRTVAMLFAINLVFTFLIPGISIAGHLGGAIVGGAISFWLHKRSL